MDIDVPLTKKELLDRALEAERERDKVLEENENFRQMIVELQGQRGRLESRLVDALEERDDAEKINVAYMSIITRLRKKRDTLRDHLQEIVKSVEGGGRMITVTDVKLEEYKNDLADLYEGES